MSRETQPETAFQFFNADEHRILSEYFGVEILECARSEDIDQQLKTLSNDFVSIVPDEDSESSSNDNAVAKLLLQGIQERLPQWAGINLATGSISFGRDLDEPKDDCISLLPQYLFGINWANSGPGIPWPEDYYVTYVPFYERYVVTRSQDSDDVYGNCDQPIGHFTRNTELLHGVKKIICKDWKRQRDDTQQRWVEIIGVGLISGDEPDRWADEVWYDPSRILTKLLEDNDDRCGTRHEVLSEQEQAAIKEAIENLPDYSDYY